jgi:hypothetical protein
VELPAIEGADSEADYHGHRPADETQKDCGRFTFVNPTGNFGVNTGNQCPAFKKGGVPWTNETSINCHFFRVDEQTPQGLPLRDDGEVWPADRPRQQGTQREVGPERSLPVRVRQAVQKVLSKSRLLLTA